MTRAYELSKLNPAAFENMINALALRILGAGATGFGPGPDGGRDGFFEGESLYPSSVERWHGIWYIQSKYHAPHLTTDAQSWLINQVKKEIAAFNLTGTARIWPDNWIIATNVELSAAADKGSFDVIRSLLDSAGANSVKLNIWGGQKIIDFLSANLDIANAYGHFLTPGHVLSKLYEEVSAMSESRPTLEEIARYFVVKQFKENLYTKLDRAGSAFAIRPAVQDLFIDLPYITTSGRHENLLLFTLSRSAAQCHRYSLRSKLPDTWHAWSNEPKRARTALIKGGPGQGKSTIGQYLCQIQRACLILDDSGPYVDDATRRNAEAVKARASGDGVWPISGRIPIQIDLKEFAHWRTLQSSAKRVLSYIAETVSKSIESIVTAATLKNALKSRAWLVIFDGLDEVPNDYKDQVASEVIHFLNDVLVEIDADVLSLCTSRPQGYSGQFSDIEGPVLTLSPLDVSTALACAAPLLAFGQSEAEALQSLEILRSAASSESVKELMTTPLQSHIMATVVRDGGRPPERRWRLFQSFYEVMKRRESLKNFGDPRIAQLLREEDLLLKSVHMHLGFLLHARAERSSGAQTVLTKNEFRELVTNIVCDLGDLDVVNTVNAVMEATTERLVLVSTPDSGEQVRFDIRQLQEFFAAEFLYDGLTADEVGTRVRLLGIDPHWREVMHFLMSALIAGRRTGEFCVAMLELKNLNEGSTQANNDLYYRRTAPAALLAGRLLMEGVVDDSKHDRQHLKPLVDAIGGILDLESIVFLRKIRPEKSRLWMVEQLSERTRVAGATEYVGSLFLLGFFPTELDQERVSLTGAFFKMPIGLQEMVIQAWNPNYWWDAEEGMLVKESKHSAWVASIAITALASAQWTDYSPQTIRALFNLCHIESENFLHIWNALGNNVEVGEIVYQCLELEEELSSSDSEREFDCSVVQAGIYRHNWTNRTLPESLQDDVVYEKINKAGGAFRLLLLCLSYANRPRKDIIDELIGEIDIVGSDRLACLPDYIIALIPVEKWQSAEPCGINHLRNFPENLDVDAFLEGLKNIILPPFTGSTIYGVSSSEPGAWKKLIKYMPDKAIEFAFEARDKLYGIKVCYSAELIDLIKSRPDRTLSHILSWGHLEAASPTSFTELKKVMCGANLDINPPPVTREVRLQPFKLSLESDQALLVWLGPSLVRWWCKGGAKVGFGEDQGLARILESYNLSYEYLRNIAYSEERERKIRAGAASLCWLLFSESPLVFLGAWDGEIQDAHRLYMSLLADDNEEWLSLAFVEGVLLLADERNSTALAAANILFARSDIGKNYRALNRLTRVWRERSVAPVSSASVTSTWVGLDVSTPSYLIH